MGDVNGRPLMAAPTLASAIRSGAPGICVNIGRAVAALLLAFVAVMPCMGDSIDVVPPGLSPGAQYRLIFVTSEGINGASSDINTYNNFVAASADSIPELAALEPDWSAIATTTNEAIYDTIARDPGIPIYNFAGQLVASDATQNAGGLFSGSLFAPIDINETGAQYGSVVWTGSWYGGGNNPCYALGSACFGGTAIVIGWASQVNAQWLTDYPPGWGSSAQIPLYGISGLLTVPSESPEPSTALSMVGGLLLCATVLKSRARRLG
jgi:hypothetical protein